MTGSLIALPPQAQISLSAFLDEFAEVPSELHGYFCPRDWDAGRVAETLDAWKRGHSLSEGWVSSTTLFWAESETLCGVINIRHHLTPSLEEVGGHIGYSVAPSMRRRGVATAMLNAALPVCRSLGISRALLTCDADNIGSIKTIERCGGELEKEAWSEKLSRLQRWYWIDL